MTVLGVASITGVAFGFLIGDAPRRQPVVPHLVKLVSKVDLPGTPTILAVMLAFGLAWLADRAGSAVIIGAFAAGLLLARTPQAREIEHGVTELGNFFVPIFFVSVGAAVDVRVFNPLDPANHPTLMVGGLLIVAAVVGKFAAGYAAPWFKGKKSVIGVGMIPRGEVGLIFAQMGLVERRLRREALQCRDPDGHGHDLPRPAAPAGPLPAEGRGLGSAGAGRYRGTGDGGIGRASCHSRDGLATLIPD